MTRRARHAAGQRGAALLAVIVLLAASATASASLAGAVLALTEEMRTRGAVLCARYAALGGLALGASASDQAKFLNDIPDSVRTTYVERAPGWCVLRSTAVCAEATRTIERTVDPAFCTAASAGASGVVVPKADPG